MKYTQGIEFLESKGINLFHAFDTPDVADCIASTAPNLDLDRYPTTVLIANAGFKLWQSMSAEKIDSKDPVDQYSISLAHEFAKNFLDCQAQILYPSDLAISLRTIGEKTGWSFTSPMGISIHPTFGTWFAYRVLFLVETHMPPTVPLVAEHPCSSCPDKPCQTVCPSGAVREIDAFGLETCARYRITDASPCAYQCLARLSCPVGVEYQYIPEQLKYHYNRSRITMLKYFS